MLAHMGKGPHMGKGLLVRAVAVAATLSLALAGCGGSSKPKVPSALDPANHVPADAVAYASVTVKPQGAMRSDLNAEIDALAGAGAAKRLWGRLDARLDSDGKGVRQWLGQRVGVALTGLPSTLSGGAAAFADDVVLVAPTGDPAAAAKFLSHHQSAGMSGKVVGDYAIFGGQKAVAAALATTPATSLARSSSYRATVSELGSGELVTVYAALHPLAQALLPLLAAAGAPTQQPLAKLPQDASAAYGLKVLSGEVQADIVTHGVARAAGSLAGADVGSLPGGSWLALALSGALGNRSYLSKLAAALPRQLAASSAASRLPAAPLRFIEQDLLPALGPLELSVSGTSLPTLRAGLVIAPLDRAAGARLAAAVRRLVRGLPIRASTAGGRVAVTFGYTSVSQLLSPSSTLAANAAFKAALAQLPSGAHAEIYVSFPPLAALAALDPSQRTAALRKVLSRLRYLIAGGVPGHFRLVLATA